MAKQAYWFNHCIMNGFFLAVRVLCVFETTKRHDRLAQELQKIEKE
jgi:hypothetical protein